METLWVGTAVLTVEEALRLRMPLDEEARALVEYARKVVGLFDYFNGQ